MLFMTNCIWICHELDLETLDAYGVLAQITRVGEACNSALLSDLAYTPSLGVEISYAMVHIHEKNAEVPDRIMTRNMSGIYLASKRVRTIT